MCGGALRRTLLWSIVFLLTAACTQLSPVETEAEKAFTPPEIYGTWYAEAEECSGFSGRFERITWLEAEVYDLEGLRRSGAWRPPHTIYLDPELVAASCDTVPDGGACFRQQNVKHEMIHDLRQGGHDEAGRNSAQRNDQTDPETDPPCEPQHRAKR